MPSRGGGPAMTETLTPQDAALALAKAGRWEDRLQHRTEGITWMVWGLVSAGIWVTMLALSRLPLTMAGFAAGWSIWVLAGFATTYVVWRSASLTQPDRVRMAPWWTWPLKAGVIAAAVFLLHYAIEPTTPAYAVAILGSAWIAMALLARRWSALGRRVGVGVGALVVAGGAALPYLASGMDAMMLGAALVSAVPATLGGLYQALRG